jgi:glycosyltransferase involved in cell wall biosynthesis
MHILIISDNYPPETNAGASRTSEQAQHWARRGHAVTVITGAPNFPQGRLFPGYRNCIWQSEQREGVRVVRVITLMAPNRGVLPRTLDFASFMVTAWIAGLFERRPDVIIGTSPQLLAAVAAWALSAARRVPFVFELRDLWPESIAAVGAMRKGLLLRAVEWLELFLYRRSSRIIAVTQSFRENLILRGIPGEKIVVMTNGADLSRYAPGPRDEALGGRLGLNGKIVVGYVGTHGMAHALNHVLDAAALLKDRDDIRFLFVGDGAQRAMLIEQARQADLRNVIFEPPQPKECISTYWKACDVALVSLRDRPGFGQVIPSKVFEAMAMGLPLLMSLPRGEASALVEHHGAGRWVPPEQPAALAAAVREMADDPQSRMSMRNRSLAAATCYDRYRIAEQTEAELQRVAEQAHARTRER